MKLGRWIQVMLVAVALLGLSACASKHKTQDELALNDANAAYAGEGDDAQSSGLGDDTKFDDHASRKTLSSNSRVYYFDFDSNVVHESDRPAIAANAQKLATRPHTKVMVEGHTDPRGSREYNIGLGERRAKAVAQILTANGANRGQIRVVSYGAEKLASTGHSESDYQRDRRGAIVYLQ